MFMIIILIKKLLLAITGMLSLIDQLSLTKWKSVEVSVFQRGWVTLSSNFR